MVNDEYDEYQDAVSDYVDKITEEVNVFTVFDL